MKYVGTKIVIYVSQNAPAGGFTDAQVAAIGTTFDTISTRSTSTPSARRRTSTTTGVVLVLLTRRECAHADERQCATQGYIAGYFDGTDD